MKESAGGGKLVPLFEKGNSTSLQKPSIFGPDDDEEMLLNFEMRTKLLEAQLDSRNRELRLTVERMRILELTLVEKRTNGDYSRTDGSLHPGNTVRGRTCTIER